jgi:ATP-dependent helicase/nuclease subunit A
MSVSLAGVSGALTDEQEQAIGRRAEPLLLAAAAGSGKTSVLVERFVRAVRDDGLAPGQILAITFTERAAGELRARVRTRLLELGDREAARDTEAAFVGTFHGFCARLLRAHSLAAGLDPDFDILDEGVAAALRARAFKVGLREFLTEGGDEAVDLLAAYKVDRVHAIVEQAHGELRSRGQRLPRLPLVSGDEQVDRESREAARACLHFDRLLGRFAGAYEALKSTRGAVDFDDLELCAHELLATHDSVRSAWSERFELLMVDEFQDTNPRQLAILRALERENLFTVGDELQSIYGFRHADVSLFRGRRDQLEASGRSLELTRNFRGRPPLLELVNAVFAKRFDDYSALYAGRTNGEPGMGAEVELLLTCTEGWDETQELAGQIADGLPGTQPWRAAEARMLAQRVAELVESGAVRAGEVVVLLRATGDLEVFERALQLAGLQTLAAVGAFWGHQQVGDLISYLRALANPLDEQALYSVLASPLAGCSRDALALLAAASREARRGAWETALEVASGRGEGLSERLAPSDREVLASFCARLQSEHAGAARWTLSELIERGIEAGGYREHVLGLDWGERRLANLQKLLRLARRFEAGEGRDLRAFLDHVERLQTSAQLEPDAPVESVEPDVVRLMSIHAAKGLEFPVVCVADLGRAPNTQTPDLLIDGERIGLRLVRLDGGKSVPTLDYEKLSEERRRREAQEEERVLYVAMTRARERLLLSGSAAFKRWPQSTRAPTPISWLAPAIAAELPELASAGESIRELALPGGVMVRCAFNTPANLGTVLRAPAQFEQERRPEPAEVRLEAGSELSPAAGVADARARSSVGERSLHTREVAGSKPTEPIQARGEALSYTALSELERCGYRYYLERVLGLGEDRSAARGGDSRGGLEARARGTLVHRLMETVDFTRPVAPTDERIAQAAGELGLRAGETDRAEIAALIDAACRETLASRIAEARSVRREHPFAFSLGPHEPLITGFIDLLAKERDGTQLVLDYKSDHVGLGADLSGLVEREYSIQRLLYALAVLRGGAERVEIVHWFLERPSEPVSARFEEAETDVLEGMLRSRTDFLANRPFQVSSNPHRGLCLSCPGRTGLCSWGDAETLREDPEELQAGSTEPGPSANAGDSSDQGAQLGLF